MTKATICIFDTFLLHSIKVLYVSLVTRNLLKPSLLRDEEHHFCKYNIYIWQRKTITDGTFAFLRDYKVIVPCKALHSIIGTSMRKSILDQNLHLSARSWKSVFCTLSLWHPYIDILPMDSQMLKVNTPTLQDWWLKAIVMDCTEDMSSAISHQT
jgi:hypothetical protein